MPFRSTRKVHTVTDDHTHSTTEHREGADDYLSEAYRLGPYRIAVCRDGLQCLFQRQRGSIAGGGALFDTPHHCLTRKGLKRLHRAHIRPETDILAGLPDRIKRGVTK